MRSYRTLLFLSAFFVLIVNCAPEHHDLGRPSPPGKTVNISFVTDILPIVKKRCTPCHDGSLGFSDDWEDYNSIFAERNLIRNLVFVARDMPDNNETKMLDEERELFAIWVDNGASP